MSKLGILAFGSLIESPGDEIAPNIISRIENVVTPFSIEFARSSSTRGGAPTVIPVETGGACAIAQILVLSEDVTVKEAEGLLWRRETGKVGEDKQYSRPASPGKNHVLVEQASNFNGIETVLYTKIGSNIDEITANNLANLAISSAKSASGKSREDGINYLISLKRQGVKTALSAEYERAVLAKTNTSNLEDAWKKIQSGSP